MHSALSVKRDPEKNLKKTTQIRERLFTLKGKSHNASRDLKGKISDFENMDQTYFEDRENLLSLFEYGIFDESVNQLFNNNLTNIII